MKTPHPYPEILKAFIEDTNVHIEEEYKPGDWRLCGIGFLVSCPSGNFRLKPAMRHLTTQDGTVVSWPEPMRVAPDYEQFFIAGYERVVESNWNGSAWQQQVLKAGFCHLSEEAAQQHRRAFVLANGGEL